MSAFEELGLNSELCALLEENEIDLPTAIQQESIPLILGGGDLCASAETGTGKTLSFIISSIQIVNELFRDIGCYESPCVNNEREEEKEKKEVIETWSYEEVNEPTKDDIQLIMGKHNSTATIYSGYECVCNNQHITHGIRGNDEILVDCPILKGKYAYEVEILTKSVINIGFCPYGNDTFRNGYTYGSNHTKINNDRIEQYGTFYGAGDIITCLIDKDRHNISFKKNGKFLGKAFNIPHKFQLVPFVPYVCGKYFRIKFHFHNLQHPGNAQGFQEIGSMYRTQKRWNQNENPNGNVHNANIRINSGEYKDYLSERNKAREIKDNNTSSSKVQDESSFNYYSNLKKLFCVVLCPTKDLAVQTYNNYLTYVECFKKPPIHIGLLVGGEMNRKPKQEPFNIVVCTCYKLLESIKKRSINLGNIKLLILDEADELINSDEQSVLQIKEYITQSSTHVQTLFFSATLQDDNVKRCINKITNKPIFVDLKYGKQYIPSHIYVCIYYVNENSRNISYKSEKEDIYNTLRNETLEKMSFSDLYEYTDKVHLQNAKDVKEKKSLQIKINKLQKLIHLINVFNMENGIIFCRTNLDCDNVYKFLNNLGDGKCYTGTVETMKENRYSCVLLKGKMPIHERESNLNAFRRGEVRFLICTDVASRGIDIKNLRHLIIFTLTDNINTFFHKIGRVGRDGKNSLCVVLAAEDDEEKVWFHTCPSKGVNCFNRNLKEEKGCTTYINESQYIKNINDILEEPMHVLDSKYFYAENIVDPLNYLARNPLTTKSRRNKNDGARTIFSDKPYKGVLTDFSSSINNIRQVQSALHYDHFNLLRDLV